MIEQIIMNLAINARDAMPQGGQLSVLLDTVAIDPTRAAGHPHVSAGPFVCISVRDTGCGISPENISRIFEPFFTTKDIGKGTGLGLATVFGIVEQHHGWIEVESEPDHGATFRVFLPALEKAISSLATVPAKPKPVGGQETILLVEDEAALRTVAAAVLEQHGYKVVATSLPAAALEIWEKKRGTIDLLLIDLIMPGGMSGRELAERLLADEPALKVLYSSGYSEDIVRRQLHLDPGRNFLQKPCSSTGLLDAVRRCLDENRA
jgi:CheY-like chemotaxis protein